MALDTVKSELMQETLDNLIIPLYSEHEIIKRYLEYGSWKKAGIPSRMGKIAIWKMLEYHLTHCSILDNQAHEIVKEYLKKRSWKKVVVHTHIGKRAVMNVLRYHLTDCLHILEPVVLQKVLWECPTCGKQIMVTPYEAKRKKYCSYECFNSVPRKRKPTSEKRKFRMSPEWRQIRKKRISDFGHTCPMTSEIEELDVHHIDSDWTNNKPENLIPLWRPLHKLITARANYDEFYEALDRTIFLSITKAWID